MEFRARDYGAEESAAALFRSRAHHHPLAAPPPLSSSTQVIVADLERVEFDDPLRASSKIDAESDLDGFQFIPGSRRRSSNEAGCFSSKEWAVFSGSLMQKFSYSSKIPISSTLDIFVRSNKGRDYGKSLADVHMEELDDPETVSEEDKKVISRQEYVLRLQELKAEIRQSWRADDHIKALKLSIKVARLLMDTSVSQFYPTLFILVIEVLDMLGDLVWERIKRKAEYSDDGTLLHSLPEPFVSSDICAEAKDTCYNWFCKIGSIRELLPRIYLELVILRCWRFLEDNHQYNLHRVTMMMRGLADPLASAYCHLYMARCAESLNPEDRGYLIASISDMALLLEQMIKTKVTTSNQSTKSNRSLMTLMEPAIEWSMKCIFSERDKKPDDVLAKFWFWPNRSERSRKIQCISIVLHHLLKQLPAEFISMNASTIIELFEQNKDASLPQYLNYRLLGLKLCESPPPFNSIKTVLNQVTEVINQCNFLDEYLTIADSYIDLILQYSMDNCLSTILDGILKQAQNIRAGENEMDFLQAILVKLINHFGGLEDVLFLNHFIGIHELLHGSSRNIVDMQILQKASRSGFISDPTTIQFLFEISQALHDSIHISDMDDDQRRAHLISSFIQKVDFKDERERHLTFLNECRASFGRNVEIKVTLVHSSNNLAIKAIRTMNKYVGFLKACMAFNEVTIPSISANVRQMNLYLETAEVAILGGLISHTEGLLSSAVSCLESLNMAAGIQKSVDTDEVVSLSCKMCSLFIIVPGFLNEGVTYLPRKMTYIIDSQSLTSPSKTKILCAVILLLASLSQQKLPYQASNLEILSNDQLFYGDASYYQQLSTLSSLALERLFDVVEEEPRLVVRGKLALEACNCLLISFKASHQIFAKCTQLLDTARLCLHSKDKYLESTVSLFDKHLSNLLVSGVIDSSNEKREKLESPCDEIL